LCIESTERKKKYKQQQNPQKKSSCQENKPLNVVLGTLDIWITVSNLTPASPLAPSKITGNTYFALTTHRALN